MGGYSAVEFDVRLARLASEGGLLAARTGAGPSRLEDRVAEAGDDHRVDALEVMYRSAVNRRWAAVAIMCMEG